MNGHLPLLDVGPGLKTDPALEKKLIILIFFEMKSVSVISLQINLLT